MVILINRKKLTFISLAFLVTLITCGVNFIDKTHETAAPNGIVTNPTVILDAGHGGEDPGAVSDYSGIKEKDINLAIAKKVQSLLSSQNVSVKMTREEDKLEYTPETTNIVQKRRQDLVRRKKMMDQNTNGIIVSIHLNKFPQTQYFGAQTFFANTSPQSQELAKLIQKKLRENVDPNNTREALAKKEPIIILKNVKNPTVVVECGFLSNQEEEKKLASPDYQDKLALAISEGIKEYLNGPFQKTVSNKNGQ